MIRLIAAIDRERGIAKNGVMPWKIPEDEQYFTDQTKTFGGNVLSGGRTFREAYHNKPLADRNNYILTRRDDDLPGAIVVHDLSQLLTDFQDKDLWVSGGAEVFAEVMAAGRADELYLTHIDADFACDRFFPEYEETFRQVEKGEIREQNGFRFYYAKYVPKQA